MASATTKTTGVTFVLELSEQEAQYVAAALLNQTPKHLDEDSVYEALVSAMDDAGVKQDDGATY